MAGSLSVGVCPDAASAEDSLGLGVSLLLSEGSDDPEALADEDADGPAEPLGPPDPEADGEGRALKLAKLSLGGAEVDASLPPVRLEAILFTAKTTPQTIRTITKRARINAMIRRRR